MRVLYKFYVLQSRNLKKCHETVHFEEGNRKDRQGNAVFQAMLVKFWKTFNEVEGLVKCQINVTNRIYELQERLTGYSQIEDKYTYDRTEPGNIQDFCKLILIFLLAKFHRTLHSFCTLKISVTCKKYFVGIWPHFYTVMLLRLQAPQRFPQRTQKYLQQSGGCLRSFKKDNESAI